MAVPKAYKKELIRLYRENSPDMSKAKLAVKEGERFTARYFRRKTGGFSPENYDGISHIGTAGLYPGIDMFIANKNIFI